MYLLHSLSLSHNWHLGFTVCVYLRIGKWWTQLNKKECLVPLHRGAALGLLGSSSNARFCLQVLVLPLSYAPTVLILFVFFFVIQQSTNQLSPSTPLLVVAHVLWTAAPPTGGISEDELISISSRPSFPIHLLLLLFLLPPAEQPDLTLNILLVIVSSFYYFISTFLWCSTN